MPAKLSTTISKIESLSNNVNSALISELCDYMKNNGLSESHINNTLKTNMLFSEFLGDVSFYDIKRKDQIVLNEFFNQYCFSQTIVGYLKLYYKLHKDRRIFSL